MIVSTYFEQSVRRNDIRCGNDRSGKRQSGDDVREMHIVRDFRGVESCKAVCHGYLDRSTIPPFYITFDGYSRSLAHVDSINLSVPAVHLHGCLTGLVAHL